MFTNSKHKWLNIYDEYDYIILMFKYSFFFFKEKHKLNSI